MHLILGWLSMGTNLGERSPISHLVRNRNRIAIFLILLLSYFTKIRHCTGHMKYDIWVSNLLLVCREFWKWRSKILYTGLD